MSEIEQDCVSGVTPNLIVPTMEPGVVSMEDLSSQSYHLCFKGFPTKIPLTIKRKPSDLFPKPIFVLQNYKNFKVLTKDQSLFVLQDKQIESENESHGQLNSDEELEIVENANPESSGVKPAKNFGLVEAY